MEPAPVQRVLIEDAEAIAHLYRRLILLIGAQFLLGYGINALARTLSASMMGSVLSLLLFAGLLGLSAFLVVTAYRLAGRLGSNLPVLWALAMFIPCINLVALLALSTKAQTWCRQYGIKVGLLGPTKESLAELRSRVVTSNFE